MSTGQAKEGRRIAQEIMLPLVVVAITGWAEQDVTISVEEHEMLDYEWDLLKRLYIFS